MSRQATSGTLASASTNPMVGILMSQRRPDVLDIPALTLDFWTSAYQLIDD